jgi:hypothetical protein
MESMMTCEDGRIFGWYLNETSATSFMKTILDSATMHENPLQNLEPNILTQKRAAEVKSSNCSIQRRFAPSI